MHIIGPPQVNNGPSNIKNRVCTRGDRERADGPGATTLVGNVPTPLARKATSRRGDNRFQWKGVTENENI